MEAARKIELHAPPRISIDIPESLQGQDVEILVFPYARIDEEQPKIDELELDLPIRNYGKVKGTLSRSEIYENER